MQQRYITRRCLWPCSVVDVQYIMISWRMFISPIIRKRTAQLVPRFNSFFETKAFFLCRGFSMARLMARSQCAIAVCSWPGSLVGKCRFAGSFYCLYSISAEYSSRTRYCWLNTIKATYFRFRWEITLEALFLLPPYSYTASWSLAHFLSSFFYIVGLFALPHKNKDISPITNIMSLALGLALGLAPS